MNAPLQVPAPSWTPVSDEVLERELRGAVNGGTTDGQVRSCGRYLIARRPSTHVLRPDRWELYGRELGRWSINTCHPTRERAEAEAERQVELVRRRGALRVPCIHCKGSGWFAGDDCRHCVGSGTRAA